MDRHYKELTYEEETSLKSFTVALDLIQRDMAALDPNLKVYLPDYEDNMMQALLECEDAQCGVLIPFFSSGILRGCRRT